MRTVSTNGTASARLCPNRRHSAGQRPRHLRDRRSRHSVRPGGNDYRVQWSGFNNRASWGVNDYAELRDTPGVVTAGRPLGPNSFAVYKEDCVYVASLQAALQPFQFQFVGRTSGPASASALIEQNGIHYWLGEDGNLYQFDGNRIQPYGEPLADTLKQQFSIAERRRSFAFSVSTQEPEIWFGYLKAGTSDTPFEASTKTSRPAPCSRTRSATRSLPRPSG